MGRGRIAVFMLFAIASAGVMIALAWIKFERPPAYGDLPADWFDRPARADPASWTLPGAGVLEINGPVRVRIVPEPRADVTVGPAPAGVSVRRVGTVTTIAAEGPHRCPAASEGPVVEVRAPLDLIVRTNGPVSADVGPTRTLMLASRGCGRLVAQGAETARISTRGAARVELGRVSRGLDAVVRGPGRLKVAELNGGVDGEAWGRGTIDIGPGFTGQARFFAKGAGHIYDRGQAGAVIAEARMMARIRIAVARGLITGAGDVEVGRPDAPIELF
ncbi:MAG: hypothetical protein JWO33_1738 [Caulobacteraceae bacterium]|nr:hypothetical protein [Caulobacteraceae bacterium]